LIAFASMKQKERCPDRTWIECIGRESNPGLAESFMIIDHEWQRPILPLNHQCNVMTDERLSGFASYIRHYKSFLTSESKKGRTKIRAPSDHLLKRLGRV
jgi:hypothetical protein